MLPACQEGKLEEKESRSVAEHLTVCHDCRKMVLELKDAWDILERWEDCDPPQKIRMGVLSYLADQRKKLWLKLMIPVAAALLIVVGMTIRFSGLQREQQALLPFSGAPMQFSADHLPFDEDEIIANLHVLQDEDFYDAMDELVKIDYLPLIDETDQKGEYRRKSSLEVAQA